MRANWGLGCRMCSRSPNPSLSLSLSPAPERDVGGYLHLFGNRHRDDAERYVRLVLCALLSGQNRMNPDIPRCASSVLSNYHGWHKLKL